MLQKGSERHACIHVNCLSLLSYFIQNSNTSTNVSEIFEHKIPEKHFIGSQVVECRRKGEANMHTAILFGKINAGNYTI
jgi:hypothetical protein